MTHARPSNAGLVLALVSAATFASSGPFAKSLLDAGWSPGAAVGVRIGGAALVMLPATVLALRRRTPLSKDARMIALYGVVAVAGAQACFFSAVQYLSVGVALLLEYLAPVLLVGLAWARTGRVPSPRTLLGTLLAVVGLVLVLDLGGAVDVDPVGVLYGLGAAVCLSVYFLLSARPQAGVTPTLLAGGGLLVGAVTIGLLGLVGVLPMQASTEPVVLLGTTTSWVVPAVVMALVSSVVAYLTGILAAGRLGSRVASFVGLTEVLFAVVFAWVLLGQLPVAVQLLGGLLILAGVAMVEPEDAAPADAAPADAGNLPASAALVMDA